MSKKFRVIVADCPWPFSDKLKHSDTKRGAAANYDLMSISDIKALPIKSYCHDDGAVLCLWVPSSLLQEGLDTMKAWGFNYKQAYIWVKTKKEPLKEVFSEVFKVIRSFDFFESFKEIKDFILKQKYPSMNDMLAFGMGRLFRQTHEICLIGTSNNKIYQQLKNKSQRSVSFAENLKHSAKPEHLQDSLELMFPGANSRIELFARRQRKGWYCLGNEAPMTKDEDIRESLKKLSVAKQKDLFPINKVISCYDEGKNKELFEMWGRISSDK